MFLPRSLRTIHANPNSNRAGHTMALPLRSNGGRAHSSVCLVTHVPDRAKTTPARNRHGRLVCAVRALARGTDRECDYAVWRRSRGKQRMPDVCGQSAVFGCFSPNVGVFGAVEYM